MKKLSVALLLVIALTILGLVIPRQAHAQTRMQQDAGIQYTTEYVNGIEWVLIPPGQLDSNQNFWVAYPAALVTYSDGTTNISGGWQVLNANLLAYMPSYQLENTSDPNYNASYAGQQQIYASNITPAASSAEDTYTSDMEAANQSYYDASAIWDDAPDWAQPGYVDTSSFSYDNMDTGDTTDSSDS